MTKSLSKNINLFYCLFLLAALSGCKDSDARQEYAASEQAKNVFVIIGQSNAAGRAYTDEHEINDRIFVLHINTGWTYATTALNKYSTVEQVDRRYYSFGWSFAEQYLNDHAGNVLMISNARGGTSVSYWAKGYEGYEETIKRILPHKDEIAAILYHQGESDAYIFDEWKEWAERMVQDFRSDLGRDVPFIFGRLSTHNSEYNEFDSRVNEVCDNLDNCAVAESKYSSVQADNTHFDKCGLMTLGLSYYLEFLRLTTF